MEPNSRDGWNLQWLRDDGFSSLFRIVVEAGHERFFDEYQD